MHTLMSAPHGQPRKLRERETRTRNARRRPDSHPRADSSTGTENLGRDRVSLLRCSRWYHIIGKGEGQCFFASLLLCFFFSFFFSFSPSPAWMDWLGECGWVGWMGGWTTGGKQHKRHVGLESGYELGWVIQAVSVPICSLSVCGIE